jgi:aspartate aminotransferase-like enzyme
MEKNLWPINLTTGPISIPQDVKEIFGQTAVSHRADEFIVAFKSLQQKICRATGARHVVFMTGSGSLANEAMIAQLKRSGDRGLLLTNGEFGNRLIHQAEKQSVSFEVYRKAWGEEYDIREVEELLKNTSKISWMLFTHCESSTGCLADLVSLTALGKKYGVKVCVDAMSTIGNIPLVLDDIFLATCSSGKGLASYAGIAIVFTNQELTPDSAIPTYLDLGHYFSTNGIPFTISSNLIMALNRAVDYSLQDTQTHQVEKLSLLLLEKMLCIEGVTLLNKDYKFTTHITTLVPPPGIVAVELGDRIKAAGIETSYNSGYLKVRNQLQIAIMGQHSETDILRFVEELKTALKELAVKGKRLASPAEAGSQ